MLLLLGAHVMVLPVVGSGALVPSNGPRYFFPLPSGCAAISPDLPFNLPEYAIHFPSGDHSGSLEDSSPALSGIDFRSDSVMIQSWPNGRPGPSLRVMV